MIACTASKAVVAALTETLAEELKGVGILLNAIAPSTLDTRANRYASTQGQLHPVNQPGRGCAAIVQLVLPANLVTSGAVIEI